MPGSKTAPSVPCQRCAAAAPGPAPPSWPGSGRHDQRWASHCETSEMRSSAHRRARRGPCWGDRDRPPHKARYRPPVPSPLRPRPGSPAARQPAPPSRQNPPDHRRGSAAGADNRSWSAVADTAGCAPIRSARLRQSAAQRQTDQPRRRRAPPSSRLQTGQRQPRAQRRRGSSGRSDRAATAGPVRRSAHVRTRRWRRDHCRCGSAPRRPSPGHRDLPDQAPPPGPRAPSRLRDHPACHTLAPATARSARWRGRWPRWFQRPGAPPGHRHVAGPRCRPARCVQGQPFQDRSWRIAVTPVAATTVTGCRDGSWSSC